MNKHSTLKIILKNTFTLFNVVNIILAVMVAVVGSYKNMLFIFVAIFNTLISIINELRAKKIVDKLKLIAEKRPVVMRDGVATEVDASEVVRGDTLALTLGDQVMFDSVILTGAVEVNEALITGEQDNIARHEGDALVSGSFVVAGSCTARVEAVGADNFVARLETEAHAIKTADSKLFRLMNNIVKYISWALIPVGALLLWSRFRAEADTTEAVTSTVAALINMIPEGLILLTSSVLALATIRLSRRKVLVQDLYAIETLARVDTICLDKTGTLTTGKMAVVDYTPLEKSFETALIAILSHQTSTNATISVLNKKFLKTGKFEATGDFGEIAEVIPFSSERKCSGIKTVGAEYLLGAVEFITDDKEIIRRARDASQGYRILAVVKKTAKKDTLLGYVRFEDETRKTAPKIIEYFYANDIDVKIISGDDLAAVKVIAEKVGVRDLRGFNMASEKRHDFAKLVREYTIFTRVKPAEKKELIRALKAAGRTVAMTGDGVNDILAMKEADASLAIGEGSDAARRAAKFVLLDSGFEGVPAIIDEGRQSINNLERSTSLFLAKTVYASILAVVFVFLPFAYPFKPIEMSLLNFACIGLPGLILALEHNTERVKNKFVTNILTYSVPVGLTVSFAMIALAIVSDINEFPRYELSTAAVTITFVIDVILIYWISRPLNAMRAGLLMAILTIMVVIFVWPFARDFFEFTFLSSNGLVISLAILLSSVVLFEIFRRVMGRLALKMTKKA